MEYFHAEMGKIVHESGRSTKSLIKQEKKSFKSPSYNHQNEEITVSENEKDIISNENGRFKCKNCDQTRSSVSLLRRHEQKSCKGSSYNHENGEIIADEKENIICQPDITYQNVEEEVSIEKGRFQCKNCNQTRSSESLLRRHEKKSCKGSKNKYRELIISIENGRFQCRNCNQIRSSKSALRRHLKKSCKATSKNHQNEEMIINENGISTLENEEEIHFNPFSLKFNENGRFQCKYCNQTRSSKSLLARHLKKSCKGLRSNHPNEEIICDESGRFPCSNCNQTFSSKNGARRHRMNCKDRPNHFFNSSLDASNGFTNHALPTSVIKIEPQDITQDKIADQIEDHFAMDQKGILSA
jgi:hypothetical protein